LQRTSLVNASALVKRIRAETVQLARALEPISTGTARQSGVACGSRRSSRQHEGYRRGPLKAIALTALKRVRLDRPWACSASTQSSDVQTG